LTLKVVEVVSGTFRGGQLDWIDVRLKNKSPDFENFVFSLRVNSNELQLTEHHSKTWIVEMNSVQLVRELHRIRPDIVVSHGTRDLAILLLSKLFMRRSVCTVFIVHSASSLSRTWIQPLVHGFLKFVSRKIDLVIAVSTAAANGSVGKIFKDVKVVPCSYPIKELPFSSVSEKRVLAAGRLVKDKGFESLIEAVQINADGFRELGWQFHIAGEGPLRDHLQSKINMTGLGDLVKLLGHVEGLWEEMDKYQIFVVPSISEAGPLTIPQALAAGTAVLSREVGRSKEWIQLDPASILLALNATSQDFSSAMMKMITSLPYTNVERIMRRERLLNFEDQLKLDNLFYTEIKSAYDAENA